MVTPDIAVFHEGQALPLDAKYKYGQGEDIRVSAADLYESLAFMRATMSDRSVLLYPAQNPDPDSCGATRVIQKIEVGAEVVWAATVSVRGLSTSGGFDRLAVGLAELAAAVEDA